MVLSLYLGVCSCWLYLERETFTLWSLESLVSAGTPDGQLLSSTMAQRLKLKATPLNLLLWTKITHDNIQLCWPTCSSFDSWVYLHAWLEKRCRTRWECKAYFNWYFEVSKHHGESTIASLRNCFLKGFPNWKNPLGLLRALPPRFPLLPVLFLSTSTTGPSCCPPLWTSY